MKKFQLFAVLVVVLVVASFLGRYGLPVPRLYGFSSGN
jgi:hypothetical protein